jgi:effector-binding domain-containing protein
MEYQVHIEKVTPQTTAVVRCRALPSEFKVVVPHNCGVVWTFLRSTQVARPGRHLALYLDREVNLEVGAEVDQPFAGNDQVVCSSTPAGLAATTAHWGPYHLLGEAHDAICQWCNAQGHTLAGPRWEVYGHWHDDPAQLRTDVFYLLQANDELAG